MYIGPMKGTRFVRYALPESITKRALRGPGPGAPGRAVGGRGVVVGEEEVGEEREAARTSLDQIHLPLLRGGVRGRGGEGSLDPGRQSASRQLRQALPQAHRPPRGARLPGSADPPPAAQRERGVGTRLVGRHPGEISGRLPATLEDHRPEAAAFYISGQLLTEDYYAVNKLAKGFLGTNNVDSNSRPCMSSAIAGYKVAFGTDGPPTAYSDIGHASCIVLWGSNAADCHPITFGRISRTPWAFLGRRGRRYPGKAWRMRPAALSPPSKVWRGRLGT